MADEARISDSTKEKAAAGPAPAPAPAISAPGMAVAPKGRDRRKWWIWVILAVAVVNGGLTLLLFVYAIYELGRPWHLGWQPAGVRWADRTKMSVTGDDLNSVFAAGNGRRVWAVGGVDEIPAGNVIIESDDGGKTWSARKSGSSTDQLWGVFGTSDGKHLWAVGNEGTVLESDDGGGSWIGRQSGTTADLRAIFSTSDGKHIWAVGGRGFDPSGEKNTGEIVESDDGGTSWTTRRDNAPGILYSIFGSSDGRRLWAAGQLGTILESEDGGATWVVRRSGDAHDTLQSIFGTGDGMHLWVPEPRAKILESSDGGATWTERDTGLEPPPPLTNKDAVLAAGFAAGDGRRVWLVGSVGAGEVVFESDDEGVTWKVRYSQYMPLFSMAGSSDGKHLWAVGEGGSILESDSGW